MMRLIIALTLAAGLVACEPLEDDPEPAEVAEEVDEVEPEEELIEEIEPPEGDPELEYQLAVVHTGGHVSDDDPLIDAYRQALDGAEPKCEQDRRLIGDMAVRSTQLAEEEGIETTPLDMIHGVTHAVDDELAPMDCTEIFAALLLLMRGG